jgi:hypothetical protein
MRARNGATAGSLDPVREGADKSVDDLCALVTPIRANDRRRVWRALEHSAKVERLGGVQRRHQRAAFRESIRLAANAPAFRNGRLLSYSSDDLYPPSGMTRQSFRSMGIRQSALPRWKSLELRPGDAVQC